MHLVSLGSSFAAGPGLAPITNTSAKRSSINYPSLLAKSLGATHTDLSVSGATLLNLSSNPQKVFLGEEFRPQVEGVPEDADVVTITGGGNDLGYIGRMMMANASSFTKMLGPVIAWAMGHDLSAPPPDEAEMVRRFQAVYDEIQARAPRAQILLVGYPALFGILADETNTPYSLSQIESFRGIAATLEKASMESVRDRPRVHYISLTQVSETHGMESDDPWVSGPEFSMFGGGPAPLHPTAKGMQEIARHVEEKMKELGIA
jgi:lysophospholipase L1-like esterase